MMNTEENCIELLDEADNESLFHSNVIELILIISFYNYFIYIQDNLQSVFDFPTQPVSILTESKGLDIQIFFRLQLILVKDIHTKGLKQKEMQNNE